MDNRVTPQSHPLVYNMLALRNANGERFGIADSHSIINAVENPAHYWRTVRDLVIAPDGSTFSACVAAVVPGFKENDIPTSEQMERAIEFASR